MAHPQLADIGACVFDAYGTLFDVHAAVARGGQSLGEKAQPISALWRQKQLEYTWLRSLMDAHTDFRKVTEEALDYAFEANSVDDPELKTKLLELYERLEAYSDAKDCLTRLHERGMKTAILSNGEPKMLAAACQSAGLADVLDAVLSVEEVGIFKPDRRVYQLAVDRLGVEASRICFVSNNAWDSCAGANFGYRVARLNRFSMPLDKIPGSPVVEMRSLDELPALLGLA